ncbi:histidine triad nucleotide-binding protein [Aliamphritea ceti]|uniref:histidine triad nucleotide-binding protein n=1 Tax=Aliamphritea ceti TaxID=1524258 RepID=UPI0021C33528|nr:histidine triad nucleotide-binding protein [Aliamphritea ceti]
MADCIFCRIAKGDVTADIVYQDEQVIAFRDIQPKAAVHLLVIPRKHIENLYDLERADQQLIAHLMLTIPKIAKQQGLDAGFRTVTNTGHGGGQEVWHMHFHLMGGDMPPMQ